MDALTDSDLGERHDEPDHFAWQTPRWLNTLVSTLAELVLVVVTLGIITAMWLPAYLASRQTSSTSAVDHGQEEMVGMFPRGR